MKSSQKIVIRENEVQAEQFILALESKYLPAIQNLASFLKGMGLIPLKDLIYSAVEGNFEPVSNALKPIIEADMDKFSSPIMKRSIESQFMENINILKNLVSELFSESVGNQYAGGIGCSHFESLVESREKWGNISMGSLSLMPFIELNEAGEPYIPDQAKEEIIDSFRDYLDKSKLDMYELQKKAAEAINSFVSHLQSKGILIDLDYVPQIFFKKYFNTKQDDNGEFSVSERIEGIS